MTRRRNPRALIAILVIAAAVAAHGQQADRAARAPGTDRPHLHGARLRSAALRAGPMAARRHRLRDRRTIHRRVGRIRDRPLRRRHRRANGARPASRLVPPGAKTPLDIDDYAWSADGRRLLIFTNTKKVWRQNTRGDYWVLDVGQRRAEASSAARRRSRR